MDKETSIKNNELISLAIQRLTQEYPNKFDEQIHLSDKTVKGETIILTGNFDIMETEVYKKDIEYNGEKKTYTIILKPLKKD